MEDELKSQQQKSGAGVDLSSLSSAIFDAEGKVRYRLSVPVGMWASFDSWVQLRHQGAATATGVFVGDNAALENLTTNPKTCESGDCNSLSGDLFDETHTTVSLLAPQIDFPWLSKWRSATSESIGAVDCSHASRPDRLLVVRDVGAAIEPTNSERLLTKLSSAKPTILSGFQFSGIAEFGFPLNSAPRFADGFLISPYYYVTGFTTNSSPAKQ